MDEVKKQRLEKKGWRFESAEDFLGLSPEETTYVELKLSLSRALKAERTRKRISQTELAKRINSSQSRVAKMEAGDPTVSIDLLVKSLLAMGASRNDLAKSIAARAA